MRHLSCFSLIVLCGCATQTKIPAPVRAGISARYVGRVVELVQSCFYGDLYDENEKWLLSPYPFSETHHIVDLNGAPIHPHGQRGIIPAGTPFLIKEIEFPDSAALAKRMLTTPRYNTWIYLSRAPESRDLPAGRPLFILLLPMDLDDEAAVEKALAEVVAPQGEVTTWLTGRRPTVQAAIANKQMVTGMSERELTAAMGTPPRRFADKIGDNVALVLWYPSQEAWLVNGVIADIKSARAEPHMMPAMPPPAPKPQPAPAL